MTPAFLLTRQWSDTDHGIQLEFWFSTDNGPRHVIIENQKSVFFVLQNDVPTLRKLLNRRFQIDIRELQLKTFGQQAVAGVYFHSQAQLYQARDLLQQHGIPSYEHDIRPTDRYLAERFITGPVNLHDKHPPRITPADYRPRLKLMSLDIETGYDNDQLYSIAFVSGTLRRVLMIGEAATQDGFEFFRDESTLLRRFLQLVEHIDPDIFIGWNLVQFDFRFLQQKTEQLKIPFTLGRNKSLPVWRQTHDDSNHFFMFIPGRVALDGIDLLKTATWQFASYSLEAVASEILGRGKLIKQDDSRDPLHKAKEITRLFRENKQQLATYNLEDCQLVWEIFEHTKLIEFAMERARLTGLELDRSGGSVAAFENLYLPRLHRKGYIAPNIGDYHGELSAPGGYVMDSQPGLYHSVLVLDYKSLYPSIIRTFKVDPYAQVAAQSQSTDNIIPGFNGAVFSKTENILPDIIEQLWQARDQAKKHHNKPLSQAIKIIMNSFYGVLGTPGCRLHDARLTSSITRRGHEIIKQTVRLIEQQGYPVIYGDTDSVFVSLRSAHSNEQADVIGKQLVQHINQHWKHHLHATYDIESFLEVQYETHYQRFFMPTARGSDKGSKKRYAGLVKNPDDTEKIIFKGLENVRTDWTELARDFQQTLYEKIFHDQPVEHYISDIVSQLKQGHLDAQLVYRKRLRQKLAEYTRNIPPHVQAALKAEKYFAEHGLPSRYTHRGWIEYVMTLNGPETLECRQSTLDYEHYIERQLMPIADSILSVLGQSMEPMIKNQFELF